MKVAIVGSRGLTVDNLDDYIPWDTEEIVSGGAKGIDTCAEEYAKAHGIPFKLFKPEYEKYQRRAPRMRNFEMAKYSDCVIAFWDGKSSGTKHMLTCGLFRDCKIVIYLYKDGRYRQCIDLSHWSWKEPQEVKDAFNNKMLKAFAEKFGETEEEVRGWLLKKK